MSGRATRRRVVNAKGLAPSRNRMTYSPGKSSKKRRELFANANLVYNRLLLLPFQEGGSLQNLKGFDGRSSEKGVS